jgi:hypothetical protein
MGNSGRRRAETLPTYCMGGDFTGRTGGSGDLFSKGICYSLGSGPTITNLTYSGSQAATGDISPAQLVANTNDWNPTGW